MQTIAIIIALIFIAFISSQITGIAIMAIGLIFSLYLIGVFVRGLISRDGRK